MLIEHHSRLCKVLQGVGEQLLHSRFGHMNVAAPLDVMLAAHSSQGIHAVAYRLVRWMIRVRLEVREADLLLLLVRQLLTTGAVARA